jgi:hypothetical protein
MLPNTRTQIDEDLSIVFEKLWQLHKATGVGYFKGCADGLAQWWAMLDDAKRKEWGLDYDNHGTLQFQDLHKRNKQK